MRAGLCVCVCGDVLCICGLCAPSLSLLSWCAILERNAPVSCVDLFFNPGRWRHICQSGCEDRIYCLVASAQDEDRRDGGTRGRLTRTEGTRKEEGAPRVAVATGRGGLIFREVTKRMRLGRVQTAEGSRRHPTVANANAQIYIRLNFTHWPKRTSREVLTSLVTVANLDKQPFLAWSQVAKQ